MFGNNSWFQGLILIVPAAFSFSVASKCEALTSDPSANQKQWEGDPVLWWPSCISEKQKAALWKKGLQPDTYVLLEKRYQKGVHQP